MVIPTGRPIGSSEPGKDLKHIEEAARKAQELGGPEHHIKVETTRSGQQIVRPGTRRSFLHRHFDQVVGGQRRNTTAQGAFRNALTKDGFGQGAIDAGFRANFPNRHGVSPVTGPRVANTVQIAKEVQLDSIRQFLNQHGGVNLNAALADPEFAPLLYKHVLLRNRDVEGEFWVGASRALAIDRNDHAEFDAAVDGLRARYAAQIEDNGDLWNNLDRDANDIRESLAALRDQVGRDLDLDGVTLNIFESALKDRVIQGNIAEYNQLRGELLGQGVAQFRIDALIFRFAPGASTGADHLTDAIKNQIRAQVQTDQTTIQNYHTGVLQNGNALTARQILDDHPVVWSHLVVFARGEHSGENVNFCNDARNALAIPQANQGEFDEAYRQICNKYIGADAPQQINITEAQEQDFLGNQANRRQVLRATSRLIIDLVGQDTLRRFNDSLRARYEL